ncbi:hypothetical protein [Alkalibacillus haloalkaliphilus]|uniref:hypothetical protein n=1 Tax=Alkalibacillus haloalkaliphilus TaxID=94136 RepID=UPI00037C2FE9|nr:hypothetical protein [Alkalibacillus haloalkaliphilus]
MSRNLTYNKSYVPLPCHEGDEVYRNGIFRFNISRIMEHIDAGSLTVKRERINVEDWFNTHWRTTVNEDHLPTVDITRPVIQAEIRPGTYTIIDGNHRIEKADREGVPYVDSYKVQGEQLVPYFINSDGYKAFVDYWNSKLG